MDIYIQDGFDFRICREGGVALDRASRKKTQKAPVFTWDLSESVLRKEGWVGRVG